MGSEMCIRDSIFTGQKLFATETTYSLTNQFNNHFAGTQIVRIQEIKANKKTYRVPVFYNRPLLSKIMNLGKGVTPNFILFDGNKMRVSQWYVKKTYQISASHLRSFIQWVNSKNLAREASASFYF